MENLEKDVRMYVGVCAAVMTTLITAIICLISLLQTKENEIETWKTLYELSQPDNTYYAFKKGDIIEPDYVFTDSLIVTESFNLPDSCETDKQIFDFIMSKTKVL